MFPFGIGGKNLSKRDAGIAAIVFAALLIFLVVDMIKRIRNGEQLQDMVGHIIVTVGIAVIVWGMTAHVLAKQPEEAPEEQAQLPEGPVEEAEEEFTEGLSEEFDEDQGDEGVESGEGSGEGGESA